MVCTFRPTMPQYASPSRIIRLVKSHKMYIRSQLHHRLNKIIFSPTCCQIADKEVVRGNQILKVRRMSNKLEHQNFATTYSVHIFY